MAFWSHLDGINPYTKDWVNQPGQTYFSSNFDEGNWDSYSFIYNSMDILIIIPIQILCLIGLHFLSKLTIFVFRAAFY